MTFRPVRLTAALLARVSRGRPPRDEHEQLVIPPLPPVPPDAPRLPGLPDHVDDGSPLGRYAPQGDR